MALPREYRAFRRSEGNLPRTIELSTEKLPDIGAHDVLIKIHAVSLNYRDVAMLDGKYPNSFQERGIAASDCAAEVVAIGGAVKDFKHGDRVAPIFSQNNFTGKEDEPNHTLGGDATGVLREYVVFDEKVLVHLPEYLSWAEAATLACAGVTAWNALNWPRSRENSRSVLLQGTGGVSMFALVLCHAAGITPIITSSSDEKIAQIQKIWPLAQGFNYKKIPDQEAEISRLTNGRGLDVVVNNTGVASLITDLKSLRTRGGVVSLVGFLSDASVEWKPDELFVMMRKEAVLKGISIGSKVDFENLNAFLEEHKVDLKPLLDRTFSFEESPEAFKYLYSGKHVGKVIIEL